MTRITITDTMVKRWREDRLRGLSLQRIALRDGVSDWTVRYHTRDIAAPKHTPRKPRVAAKSGKHPEPAYLEERPPTRLRQKLAEIRERGT